MCGIAGIWHRKDRVTETDTADIRSMIQEIAHRGPDGQGFWSNERLAFGHCRLAILDPSDRGLQPATTPDESGALVYNGEVYNFRELRAELQRVGINFISESDTEVVLWALHHWGVEEALQRFTGMFAFAYFDKRKEALWLCRDRLGIKALSFASVGDRYMFASEDKALLRVSGFETHIDTRSLTLALAFQSVDSYLSSFRNVRRLPPGACWRIDNDGVHEGSFWHALDALDPLRLGERRPDTERAKTELEARLRASVGMHCLSDTELATACSGGVDSGMITALTREFVNPFHAYVIDPDTGVSEAEDAQRTCSGLSVPLKRVALDRAQYLRLLATSIYHVENGNLSNATPALLALTRRCKADGIKVLLTGEGSDELFGGYPWHAKSARRASILSLIAALGPTRSARKRRLDRLIDSAFVNAMGGMTPSVAMKFASSLSAAYNFRQHDIMEALEFLKPISRRVYAGNGIFDLCGHMQGIIHRHDRVSMASSVELRVPFLENGIIDFALNLPPALKYRKRQGKWLLKQVASRYLPAQNILAKKKGFPVTNDYFEGTETLLNGGVLRELMGWSIGETGRFVAMCGANPYLRARLVGHEVFARIYGSGETAEDVGEKLVGAAGR
ncbi:asparagine synthase (glutamine-hydrolyzing) [Hoeflea prorocentri]|uniref:asparagine synthase (glutamine-hydrolyzing) n=1 Tax=Hoeflea prorocentri TaxID=1922333 RepID=A0A9X3UMM4_9HYPH|nr:asparagine synthase (glutamine-hydrolyzing) [Hoeflea prorocentri]MCY6383467.1 asparagine synthase (glutamine-hydrolyzing) [Hoeflea prorocentri]MDA5401267.1 asparagine synthase (glutamine-hydrolyzing) [Hoeflea prorocentri]